MWLILQQEQPDDYVLATGETTEVQQFVEWSFAEVGIQIIWKGEGLREEAYDTRTNRCLVKVDPRYFRPAEVDLLIGDPTKAHTILGWKHTTSVKDLCAEMVREDIKTITSQQQPHNAD
jgi:GDPmannose 4,6-dehydratase